jgi:hypothetical protein
MEQHAQNGNIQTFNTANGDLHTEQEAKVLVEQGTTEWFPTQKGVRQGCIFFPGKFNLYSKYINRTVGLEDMEAAVKIGRQTHVM